MTRASLHALLDTLLPGDADEPPLPAFSAAEIDMAALEETAQPLFAALDHVAFARATPGDRIALLRQVEIGAPDVFRAFLAQALAAYYQSPRVLAALGWRSAPPQPAGHRLGGNDDGVWPLLDKVRRRGKLWRG